MRRQTVLTTVLLTASLVLTTQATASQPLTPCEQPLGWRVGQIDPHFELDVSQLEREVRQAAELWNEAAGRTVLTRDEQNGFPINLVHDERQQRAAEVNRLQDDLRRLEAELERRQQTLEADQSHQTQRREAYQQAVTRYESNLREHNRAVEAANRGRADSQTVQQIRRQAETLEQQRRQLQKQQEELQRHQQAIQQHTDTYNELVERYNAHARQLTRASRQAAADSGEYRADITRDHRGNMVSIRREIDIYFFFDRHDLRWTLAHELGHALGIGHVAHPDAVMHAAYLADSEGAHLSLHSADIQALHALCD